MTRHVLVTGALGFLGYPALLAAAGEGWDVTGLDLLQPPQPIPGAHFVRGDITNVHQIYRVLRERAIDTIIHTGGISGPMLERDDPFLVCSANVIGTINLLEAARVNGVRRFVFLSSAHAYGDTPPAGSPIPPGADLHFTVQVLEVAPMEAIMRGAQGGAGGGQPGL